MGIESRAGPRRSTLGLSFFMVCLACAPRTGEEERSRVDYLFRGGLVMTMDPSGTVYDPGYVAVRGEEIVGVGPLQEGDGLEAETVIEAAGKILLPGLVNGHQHAAMALLRGVADDLRLLDWLEKYIFPLEAAHVNPDFVYWGTLLSALEMVRSGTTTFADMYYYEEEVARAAAEMGIRTVAGQTVLDFPAPDYQDPKSALEGVRRFVSQWQGHPLVIPAVAPHSAYTCSEETLLGSMQLAEELDVPVLIHLAEDREEVRRVREKTGLTPVRYLNRLGLLRDRVVAAHVIWVDEEEIGMLAQSKVGVIHNPESNMKLAAGVSPVLGMLAAGVSVGLGTDGPVSNNNLDLFQEMDTMAKLQKLALEDPTAMSARQALAIATRGGAAALNLLDEIGSLEVGKKADLILLAAEEPRARPLYDPYSTVVYALLGDAVETVMVQGRLILRERRFMTVDPEAILQRSRFFRQQIQEQLQKVGSEQSGKN